MATLGNTAVTSGNNLAHPFPLAGGSRLEFFRVSGAGSGTVGDTAALTPKFPGKVLAAISGHSCTNNADGTLTNVTLTLTASLATNVTFDVAVVMAE